MTISATDILVHVCFKTPLLYLLTQKVAQKFGYVLGIKWDDTLDSILETLTISFKEEAKEALTRLNQAIAEEEELGEDYTIGGAYLLHLKDMSDANSSLEAFWNSYLGTIINEYLKGLLSQKDLKEKVTSLKNKFLEAKTDKQ